MRTAEQKRARADWSRGRRAEVEYGSQLRKVAKWIASILRGWAPSDPDWLGSVTSALRRYADMITPWATSVAKRMIFEVAKRTDNEWRKVSAEMGTAIRATITSPDEVGLRFRGLLDEQVTLIRSLPLDAAKRVHEQVSEGIVQGKRASEIAEQIAAEQPGITMGRARLIARTETGRAATALLQSRAESVGSTEYIWRTAHDAIVRPSHAKLDGKTFKWASPPVCDPPDHRSHPGAIFNCRCWAEPILPSSGVTNPSPRFAAMAA